MPNQVLTRLKQWLEPDLFQPFVIAVLLSLTLSEFVRGALTLSLLPTYGRTVLGFAVEWTALALSMHYLVDNLLRAPVGWLVDRMGQRLVLMAGFSVAAASVFLMMHVRSVAGLILSTALYGVGVTPMWPSAVSGIGRATSEKNRASFMGYVYIFWLAGMGLGPVAVNFLIGRTYAWAFYALIAVDLTGLLMVWKLLHHPRVSRTADSRALPHPQRGTAYWHSLLRNIREAAFLFPGMFIQTYAVASLIPILSVFAKVVLHISGPTYSLILVAGGSLTVLLLIPAGKLVDRYGPRGFLVTGFLVSGLCLGLYTVQHSLWTTYLVVGILGACYAFILPAWNSVLDHSIDSDKKGTLWGVFMTVEGAGSTIGPYVGGLLWDTISPAAPFLVSAGVIVVMGLLYIVLPLEPVRQRVVVQS